VCCRHRLISIPPTPFYLPFVFFLRFHDQVVSETKEMPGAALDRGGQESISGRLCALPAGGFSLTWRDTGILWCRVPDRSRCTTRYCVGRHRCRKSLLLALRLHLERKDRCACRRGFSIGLPGDSPRGSPCSSIEYCAPEKGLIDPSPGSCPGAPEIHRGVPNCSPGSGDVRGSYLPLDRISPPGG